VALLVALTPDERSSRDFVAVLEALDERFRGRLGLTRSHATPCGGRMLFEA
jgi:hypothetical protein